MLRSLIALAAIVFAAALAAIQLASSAAYGDLAARPSLPALLHRQDPALLRALAGGSYARASAAVHNRDLAAAERILRALPDSVESADLRGRIAQARGERDDAVSAYVRAGDVVRAQSLIDALARTEPARALTDQERLVAGLRNDPSASEETGQAWWRLGELQALAGYRDPAHRARSWGDAESSYERALAYAPNEETYLLAAGYQSLANGDAVRSARWYVRAAQVVPDSAAAYAGLAWSSAARGDCAAARRALTRSRALAGTTVRDPADDPQVGPPLRRCIGVP